MSIGKLRHRITLQRLTPVINENGFESEQLQEFKTVWAEASNLHGKEYFEAMAVQAENTIKFTIRFLEGLDQTMQILFARRVQFHGLNQSSFVMRKVWRVPQGPAQASRGRRHRGATLRSCA